MNNLPAAKPRPCTAGAYATAAGWPLHASANRAFLERAVTWLAAQRNIRQFLDIGSGTPNQRVTHHIAGDVRPDCRVLYVEGDPHAAADAEPLLAGVDGVGLIRADARDPRAVLRHPRTRELIDLTEPVGLLVAARAPVAVDAADPWGPVARYVAALPSGSYLALCVVAASRNQGSWQTLLRQNQARGYAAFARTRTEPERFFADDDGTHLACAAVGRKP